ncbi:MAG: type 4a pilus biogenesis protein PilO [Thermoleophilia bacterium]
MKKRDIGILIGLGVVVLLVAWYFLIISPKKEEAATRASEYQAEKRSYDESLVKVQRIGEERSAAKAAAGDLLKLSKLVPPDSQVPSMIVEMQSTADSAGLKFMKIVPDTPVAGTESGTIVPFQLEFQGEFYDVNDFLYRVENFARMEGTDVNVTGRLISVVTLELVEPEIDGSFPDVLVKIGANAYMTSPPPPSKTASRSREDSAATAGG